MDIITRSQMMPVAPSADAVGRAPSHSSTGRLVAHFHLDYPVPAVPVITWFEILIVFIIWRLVDVGIRRWRDHQRLAQHQAPPQSAAAQIVPAPETALSAPVNIHNYNNPSSVSTREPETSEVDLELARDEVGRADRLRGRIPRNTRRINFNRQNPTLELH